MTMREQFESLTNAYAGATEAGDAEAISRLYTEDAMLLMPGDAPIKGRQAIQESYRKELEEGYNLMINILDFQDQGDTAYAAGTWESEYDSGTWLDVVKRQSDDSLQLHRVCWNQN